MSRIPIRIASPSKYRAKRTQGYASAKEANRAAELKLMEREGLITNLRDQVRFTLLPPFPQRGFSRPLVYVADFVYVDKETGKERIEDVKGMRTPVYLVKRRLMAQILGLEVTEV